VLSIIIPYRDREQHLKKFIPHMNNFLKGIDYKIVIVEQEEGKAFNRAKLLNIGFDLTKEKSSYFCFHDIDMLPASSECDYSFVKGVCKLSYYVSQFNFIPRPDNELGGVTLIDKDSFLDVNGYSNNYWGWGVEDNDFALRCSLKGINFSVRKGKYISLFHKPNGDTYGDAPSENLIKNRKYFQDIRQNKETFFSDGISALEYKVLDFKNNNTFFHYKVSL